MSQDLVTKTEFAARAGKTASGALRWLSRNAPDSVHGNLVDVTHPKVAAYIEKGKKSPTPKRASARPTASTAGQRHRNYDFVPMDEIENLTVAELVEKYKGMPGALAWVEFHKKVLATRFDELRLAKEAGKVVDRDYVEKFVFGALDALFSSLLSDAPQRLSLELSELVKAGATPTRVQKKIHDETSKLLKGAKHKIQRALTNA